MANPSANLVFTALAHPQRGELPQVVSLYHQAIAAPPANSAPAYNNLGSGLRPLGRPEESNNPRFHLSLAKLAIDKHELATAETHLLTARRLDPRLAEARLLLGGVYFEQGRLAEAQKEYRGLLAERPNDAALHCRLGSVLMELNQREEALACFRAALRVDPNHAHALAELATELRDRLPAEDQAELHRLLNNPNLPDVDRTALLFASAHVSDARRDYEAAARYLEEANRLEGRLRQQRGLTYNPEAHANFVDRLLTVFSPALFERTRGFGLDSECPVFIVGLPRSGTTLLEQVLASHSRVFGAGELRLAREDFETLGGGGDGIHEARAFDIVEKIDAGTVRQLAQNHLDRLAALDGTAERIIDKMPDNYLYVGFMHLLFPRARFLHCCRDVRDVAVSCWMTHFREIPWSNDFEQIAHRFGQYRRVMEHWHSVLPSPVLDVHYEEMVEDLEGVARRVVDFLGLEWEPACLEYHRNQRPVRTASLSQVRQPIYRRSLARWRNYEKSLQPLFARLQEMSPPTETAELEAVRGVALR